MSSNAKPTKQINFQHKQASKSFPQGPVYPKEALEVASCHCGGPAGNPGAFSVPGLVAQTLQFSPSTAGCGTTKDICLAGTFLAGPHRPQAKGSRGWDSQI